MPALQGLSGLYADPQDLADYMDEGVYEARAAPGTPDAEHGEYGSQSYGYSGTVPGVSPFAAMGVYEGGDSPEYGGTDFRISGDVLDKTPDTHKAPYPRGILQQSWASPDELALAGIQQTELHQPDMGGPRAYNGHDPAGREEPSHYTTDRYDAPNENYLSPDVPGQLRGSYGRTGGGYNSGTADVTQGYGKLNSLDEFQMGHSIRRVQHDTVHFDFTNTHGEQDVPFWGRHPVQQMPLDGPDSPYYAQGAIDGANIPWEGRIGDPSPYAQPPEPSFAAPSNGPDVFAWG
jgi:hypothetical protein